MTRPGEQQAGTGTQRSHSSQLAHASSRKRLARDLSRNAARGGFTLFEMIVVLAVMAGALAMSWPAMARMYAHHRIRQSADLVQVRLMSARVHAVDTGLTYQFRFEPGGQRFIVVPFELDPSVAGGGQQTVMKHSGRLPAAVHFDGNSSGNSGGQQVPDELLAGLPDLENYTGVSWSPPILFFTDGTAMPVELKLRDTKNQAMRIAVRAMTGGVTISGVE